jgi:hypothetical protein
LTPASSGDRWDHYLAELDAAASRAADRIRASCEARARRDRIARIGEGMRGLMAGDDRETRLTRASFVQVLERGPQAQLSLWDLPPGEAGNPHRHRLAGRQLLLMLGGRSILRTPEGRRELQEGETVALRTRAGGRCELENSSQNRLRFLTLSASAEPYLVI